jgi:hypothetical protein
MTPFQAAWSLAEKLEFELTEHPSDALLAKKNDAGRLWAPGVE